MCYNVSDSERLSHLKVRRIEGSVDSNKKFVVLSVNKETNCSIVLLGLLMRPEKKRPYIVRLLLVRLRF